MSVKVIPASDFHLTAETSDAYNTVYKISDYNEGFICIFID